MSNEQEPTALYDGKPMPRKKKVRPRVVAAPARYVTLSLAEKLTGTPKEVIAACIKQGLYKNGEHYIIAPDGRALVCLWNVPANTPGIDAPQMAKATFNGKPMANTPAAPAADKPTHLYRHFDAAGRLLYVGISLSAVARLAQHAQTATWFGSIVRVDVQQFPTRREAMIAERKAIREEAPLHNVAHARRP